MSGEHRLPPTCCATFPATRAIRTLQLIREWMGPGGFRRLQNGCDPTPSGRVGSIPARSRQLPPAHGIGPLAGILPLVVCLGATPIAAQQRDSARAAAQPPRRDTVARIAQARDTLGPPITPRRAFLYSLALPGLGQSKLGRPSAGAVYFGFELTSIAMLSKSAYDLRIAKRRVREHIVNTYQVDAEGRPLLDSLDRPIPNDTLPNRYAATGEDELRSRLKARRLHYEDWVAMLFFTHLFAGADAFVSAHLWDLPAQVGFEQLPGGAKGIGIRLPFR